jgi:hypothetical protein
MTGLITMPVVRYPTLAYLTARNQGGCDQEHDNKALGSGGTNRPLVAAKTPFLHARRQPVLIDQLIEATGCH